MHASTDSLCTSKPAQHCTMFSMADSYSFTRKDIEGCDNLPCVLWLGLGQATIWGAEQCPDQTDGRANYAPRLFGLHSAHGRLLSYPDHRQLMSIFMLCGCREAT